MNHRHYTSMIIVFITYYDYYYYHIMSIRATFLFNILFDKYILYSVFQNKNCFLYQNEHQQQQQHTSSITNDI